jgi:hypothetical protein
MVFWNVIYRLSPVHDLVSYIWTSSLVLVIIFKQLPIWSVILGGLVLLPVVSALPDAGTFPDISFKDFGQFIQENFGPDITLSQVLVVLFSLTENTDLLSLHARQQNPKFSGEARSSPSAWIKCLARGLQERLGIYQNQLYADQEIAGESDTVNEISKNLDTLAKILGLYPYDSRGKFKGKLKPISYGTIQPAHVICPNAVVCQTATCKPRSLVLGMKLRDIPQVTLIKGCTVHSNVQVLTGQCPKCKTLYMADHERVAEGNRITRVYLNAAKYLKIGQSLWVDRVFAGGVVNGMYSFHASAAAYTEYWNNSFSSSSENPITVSRRQIWQAFVQETIRSIAAVSNIDVELQDGLAIDDVTKEAFELLGENGIICPAGQHTCAECTQPYKHSSDRMPDVDPAAVFGVDENRQVPGLMEGASTIVSGIPNQPQAQASVNDDMDIDDASVNMVVLDGIVMGPTVCQSLYNHR